MLGRWSVSSSVYEVTCKTIRQANLTQFELHMGATNSSPSQFGLSLWLFPLGFSCSSETHESQERDRG